MEKLTSMLRPHILRRTKENMDIRLPEIREIVVKVLMIYYNRLNLLLSN
jgi:hypothetical protein